MFEAHDYQLLGNYLSVGALLFVLGVVGCVVRRSLPVMLLCIGLMLQGAILTLAGFSVFHGTWSGQVFVLCALVVSAMDASLGLAVIRVSQRERRAIDVTTPPFPDDSHRGAGR
jgi:NADH-quinone oxidoreductase subunit K